MGKFMEVVIMIGVPMLLLMFCLDMEAGPASTWGAGIYVSGKALF